MFPLGFALPAILLLLVALAVAVRDWRSAIQRMRVSGVGPLVTNTGEVMMIAATMAVFAQGRPAGLEMSPLGGYILFLGGTALVFVGMTMESLRTRGG